MWPRLLALVVLIHLAPAMLHQLDLRQHQMEEEWTGELRGESGSLSLGSGSQWHPKYQEASKRESDTLTETFLKRIRRILADY